MSVTFLKGPDSIRHSGGDVLMGRVRLTPEMIEGLLDICRSERARAIQNDTLDWQGFRAAWDYQNALMRARNEQRRWRRAAGWAA